MENKFSRKVILLMVISFVFALALSAQTRQVDLSPSASQALLHNNSDLGFDVHYTVGELQIREVQTKAGMFDELFIEDWTHTGEVGEPKLPLLRKIIAVPLGADVRLTVNSQTTRELDTTVSQLKHRLLPAQAPVSKSADPATLPFVVNEASYQRSGYNDRDCVRVEDLGMMRGLRIFALDFFTGAIRSGGEPHRSTGGCVCPRRLSQSGPAGDGRPAVPHRFLRV